MITRRQLFKYTGLAVAAGGLSWQDTLAAPAPGRKKAKFRFSLNTSTISGQKPGVRAYIEIASRAGYDGIELWVRDVRSYLEEGNDVKDLKKLLDDSGIRVEDAIGFAPWLVRDEARRQAGLEEMQRDMDLVAGIGCKRIAAPAFGVSGDESLDLFWAGHRYKELIDLGRRTGVMPQLEFWGASPYLYHIGQAAMVCMVADDADAHILADVFHMFRGGSGFDTLNMLKGNIIEIFHMNDYPSGIPREQQKDSDRVYPGDGVAPMKKILTSLSEMGGEKVLSVELFNKGYWQQDPDLVARTALDKMKTLVADIS